MLQTCREKRTPAQGRAVWTGLHWTAVSSTSWNFLTHIIIFCRTSRRTTNSPFLLRYLQRRLRQSSFFSPTAMTTSFKIASLSSRLKSTSCFSSSLKSASASCQRFLVSLSLERYQLAKLRTIKNSDTNANLLEDDWREGVIYGKRHSLIH